MTLVAHAAPGRSRNQGCVDNISFIPVLFWLDEVMRNQVEIKTPLLTCSYLCRNMREITWVAFEAWAPTRDKKPLRIVISWYLCVLVTNENTGCSVPIIPLPDFIVESAYNRSCGSPVFIPWLVVDVNSVTHLRMIHWNHFPHRNTGDITAMCK